MQRPSVLSSSFIRSLHPCIVAVVLLLGAAPLLPALAQEAQQQPAAGDALAGRVGRLESQIGNLQVSIGTLESLLRATPGVRLKQEEESHAASSPSGGSLDGRVGALETQIGALTNQIERMSQQLSAMEARLGGEAPQQIVPPSEHAPPPVRQGQTPDGSPDTGSIYGDTSKPRWFGPLPGPEQKSDAGSAPETMMSALPAQDAQSLYQQGYGDFLQGDYGSAEASFRAFVESYPKDPLAGNAQYWLGESYYARGQYKSAADAFLKGYKLYRKSDKAPDTLLKLAMSLAALGQIEAACSTFGELGTRFPNAPDDIRGQAQQERLKAGCK